MGKRLVRKGIRGSSLIELMVALGIMSIIMVAFLRMTSSSQDEIANVRSKLGQVVLAEDIRFHVSVSELCRQALQSSTFTKSATSASTDIEFDLGGQRLVKSGVDLRESDNVVVRSLRLTNPTVVSSLQQLPEGLAAGTGEVISGTLELTTAGGARGDWEHKPLNIGRLNLLVNASSQIIDCNGVDLSVRAPAGGGNAGGADPENTNAGNEPCLDYAANSPSGSPSWASKWPEMRKYACDRFTYPMGSTASMTICEKGIQSGGIFSPIITREFVSCQKVKGTFGVESYPAGVYEYAKVGPMGPFKNANECAQASMGSGMQVLQSWSDGYGGPPVSGLGGSYASSKGTRLDMCIGGRMISFVDTDTDTDTSSPTYQPPAGDGS